MDPAGKVALVTGGASGIGLAICEQLLENKVKGLVFTDVNADFGAKELANFQKKYGSDKVIFLSSDVRNKDQFEEAFKRAKKSFGRLDIVCNNAGVIDENDWEKEVDVNMKGVIRGTILAFKYMGKDTGNEGGVVVNTASIGSFVVCDMLPIYGGTKFGVMGLTKGFGTPLHFDRTGVRVVAICPGTTRSGLVPSRGGFWDSNWTSKFNTRYAISQPAEYVGRGVVQIIRDAPNGSLWLSEKEEPIYRVDIPPLDALRV